MNTSAAGRYHFPDVRKMVFLFQDPPRDAVEFRAVAKVVFGDFFPEVAGRNTWEYPITITG
jgi:hypothetical protein